jgi:hypothetical protein
MQFQIPGMHGTRVRIFERVATVDPTYDIFDVGVETENGIDSVVVGGSFATAKSWIRNANDKAAETFTVKRTAVTADESESLAEVQAHYEAESLERALAV